MIMHSNRNSKFKIRKPIAGAFFEANLAMLLLHILCVRTRRRWGGAVVDQAPILQEEEDPVKECDVAHERLLHLGECEPFGGLFFVLFPRGWP